jgi:hypothetical protein
MKRCALFLSIIEMVLGSVFVTSCLSDIDESHWRNREHVIFDDICIDEVDFTDASIQEIVQYLQWDLHLRSASTCGCVETNRNFPTFLLALPESLTVRLPRVNMQVRKEKLGDVIQRAVLSFGLEYHLTTNYILIAEKIHGENIFLGEGGEDTKKRLENIEIPLIDCREAKLKDVVAALCSSEMQSNSSSLFTKIDLDQSLADCTISLDGRFLSLFDLLKALTCILPCKVEIHHDSVHIKAHEHYDSDVKSENAFDRVVVSEIDFEGMTPREAVEYLQWVVHLETSATNASSSIAIAEPSLVLVWPEQFQQMPSQLDLHVVSKPLRIVVQQLADNLGLECKIGHRLALLAPEIHDKNITVSEDGAGIMKKLQNTYIRYIDWRNAALSDVILDINSADQQEWVETPVTQIMLGEPLGNFQLSLSGRNLTILELLEVLTRIAPIRVEVGLDKVVVWRLNEGFGDRLEWR